MVKWLKAKYQQLFDDGSSAMMITHRKIHDYLSMQLDFSAPGEVSDYDPLCKGDCDFI
jgi:hypothetical protein